MFTETSSVQSDFYFCKSIRTLDPKKQVQFQMAFEKVVVKMVFGVDVELGMNTITLRDGAAR